MKPAIAIMVKTPGVSPIKTRLALGIGPLAAEHFHRLAANALKEVLETSPFFTKFHRYWAVAEKDAPRESWNSFRIVRQRGENFSERIGNLYEDLRERHGGVILIAADSPQICIDDISELLTRLQNETGFFVGPAVDGGFYVFGGNQSTKGASWGTLKCGTNQACQDLVRILSPYGNVHTVKEMGDVDTVWDLVSLSRELNGLNRPTYSQKVLSRWITAQIGNVERIKYPC